MAQNIITGTPGRDRLVGTAGDDLINGLAGKDHLHGLQGNDDLHGGLDDDMLWGGLGDDLYFVDTTGEKVFERRNEGIDTVVSSISYTLPANVERLVLVDFPSATSATGNKLDNEIIGSQGDNVIAGKGGNDTLDGALGRDTYVFDTPLGRDNVDTVQFVAGTDLIQLDAQIFKGVTGPGAFAFGPAAMDADDRIIFDASSGALMYDPDGTGSQAAVTFAILVGAGALSPADFVVV
jgi:Ca2+-binding RTX toxin-like protein